MDGMYWYISRPKIEALHDHYARSPANWLEKLSVTIKAPFVEVTAPISLGNTLFHEAELIEKRLLESGRVAVFPDIEPGSTFFSFRGPAHRTIQHAAYWVAIMSDATALLLVGSASNAIGSPPKDIAELSPSADPIGAINIIFEQRSSSPRDVSVSESCSYIWATIVEPVRTVWNGLPRVEGISVYGGRFPANTQLMQNYGFGTIREIVVASPLFVRQL